MYTPERRIVKQRSWWEGSRVISLDSLSVTLATNNKGEYKQFGAILELKKGSLEQQRPWKGI